MTRLDGPRRPGTLADPLFRLLWTGEALASVSEQLFLVCLTLLVLDVSGPGATLGLVLAVAAVPRAVLLVPGGLLADRVDPARIVVIATWLRTFALAVLAAVVVLDTSPVWVVAALAAVLGALDAAYYPASLALLPRVVPPSGLVRANALVQGVESAGDLLGPILAVGVVTTLGSGGGLGAVTVLYLLAGVVLTAFARRLGRARPHRDVAAVDPSRTGWGGIRDGLRFAWSQPVVRTVLLALAVLNVAVAGPVLVGGAVLAEQRLGGTGSLGILFAGFGVGSLAGLITAGFRPIPHRGPLLIGATALIGAGTAALGAVHHLVAAAGVLAVVGLGAAYLGVVLVAWLQELVPDALRGRVMSLVVLATVAFDPVSYALAGVFLPAGVTAVFVGAGSLVIVTAAGMACVPALRRFA